MPPPTTPEKSGGKLRPGNDLIPLVIASHPGGFAINYNRMTEIDPQKRTYYALEHKFRKFKARAREICDAEGGKALDVGKPSVEKAGAKSPNDQHEDLIPLLIASIPGRITLNFKRMKELDPHGRTASSLEHKFRKYKVAAKDILIANGIKTTEDENSSAKITPTPTPSKKRKIKREGMKGESDNGEMTPTKKPRVVKRDQKNASAAGVKEENLDDNVDRVNVSAKEEPGAGISDEETEDARLEATMTRKRKPAASKPRPRKKGLAIILKKEPAFFSKTESDGEEEDSVKRTPQPKPLKKGLARAVKKEATVLSETESDGEEDDSMKPTPQPKPLKKGLARAFKKEATVLSETESEDKEEEEPIKASLARNGKRKAVGADKTEADGKRSIGKATKDCLAEDAASNLGGATAGVEVGEASGAPSKESAIRLLFE